MYEAKARGRNRLAAFSPRLQTAGKVGFRRDWQNRLRSAIQGGTLDLRLQPIFDLSRGVVCSQELLVRLPAASGSSLGQSQLFDAAAELGLGRALDRWLIDQALALAARLRAQGKSEAIVFCVGREALSEGDIMEALDKAGVQAGEANLVLRLKRETLAEGDHLFHAIEALRARGCFISTDEIRATASAFRKTGHLPIDFFRLDGGMVSSLQHSPIDQEIARGFVSMARRLGVHTVAEAVNDNTTVDILRSIGVEYALGNVFGRPRSLAQVLKGPPRVGGKAA
jgi:EAL domain-containing protein (putative c-di-GMP-specific phosphodiesterase class I)